MTTTVAQEPKASFGAWWMVGVLLLFSVISYTDRTVIVMLVDPIQQDLGLTDFRMSLILGPAFGVLYALFSVPSGWAADKAPRRWIIFAGVLIWSVTTMLCGLANSFAGLFVARMFVAIGEATLLPTAYSVITDRFPRDRVSTALAVFNMGPKAGQSAAFIIGGLLIGGLTLLGAQHLPLLGQVQPWQMMFLALGAPGLLLAFLVFSFPEPSRTDAGQAQADQGGLVAFLKQQRAVLIPLFVGFCLVGIASGAMSSWVATFMSRVHGWSPAQFGPAIGIVNAIAALSLLPKGLIIDWLYARGYADAPLRFYTWLLAICAPLAPISYFVPSPYLFLVMYAATAAVAIPLMLYASATLRMLAPSHLRGRLIGVIVLMFPISQAVGAPIVGALTDFVFKDPSRIGVSIAITAGTTILGGLLALRYTLGPMRRALAAMAPIPAAATA